MKKQTNHNEDLAKMFVSLLVERGRTYYKGDGRDYALGYLESLLAMEMGSSTKLRDSVLDRTTTLFNQRAA